MSELKKEINNLENVIEEMQLDAHASRVAIAVLSTALSSVIGKDTNLGEMYLSGIAGADPIEFKHPVADDYRDKLNEKVTALLGKIN